MTNPTGLLTMDRILDVGRKLLELRPLDEVLDTAAAAIIETMHAENALVILRDSSGDGLRIAASRHASEDEGRTLDSISRTLIDEAMAKHKAILTESAVEDPRFANRSSVILQHILAAAVIPLLGRKGAEGVLYLDSRSDRDLFRDENLPALSNLAAFAMLGIENARRWETTRRALEAYTTHNEMRRGALVGASSLMQELYAMIDRVAKTDLPVFIEGESGTGKELAAREVHQTSVRATKPFMALYCGNVSPEIFESELFGHKRGSFTGAVSDKPGLVQAVEGGTLFLDEVADIPLPQQAKVLRFLQSGEYRVVGDTAVRHADVRIISATNRIMSTEIQQGRFREDLYFRLYILPISMPPLRERLSDIPLLVQHFLRKGGRGLGSPISISPEALQHLCSYSWPGNVRELENTITRARVVAQSARIEAQDLMHPAILPKAAGETDLSWQAAERRHVLEVLQLCDGNKSRTAKVLGVSRRFLYYKLEEWNPTRPAGAARESAE